MEGIVPASVPQLVRRVWIVLWLRFHEIAGVPRGVIEVFSTRRADLLAAALAWKPGAVSIDAAAEAVDRLERHQIKSEKLSIGSRN